MIIFDSNGLHQQEAFRNVIRMSHYRFFEELELEEICENEDFFLEHLAAVIEEVVSKHPICGMLEDAYLRP